MPVTESTDSHSDASARSRSSSQPARRTDSRTLLGGETTLMIEHAGSQYVLRMTRNNKLILTK